MSHAPLPSFGGEMICGAVGTINKGKMQMGEMDKEAYGNNLLR